MSKRIKELAEQADKWFEEDGHSYSRPEWNGKFAELVRADAIASEREAIMDEWWICVLADLEHGPKSLNERAAEKWKKEYPAIAGFAEEIKERGNT